MQTIKLYIKDWLAIHPYIQQQTTDRYFVDLANRLYSTCTIREIPESIKKKLCLYTAAYFEDVISGRFLKWASRGLQLSTDRRGVWACRWIIAG